MINIIRWIFKIYQLKRICPLITAEIAYHIYKQTILPLIDYGEFTIESGPVSRVNRLERLQKKALKCIDNGLHKGKDDDVLYCTYNIQPLTMCWREHIACVMYIQSRDMNNVELCKPRINLHSNKKIRFEIRKMRQYELYLRSLQSRGNNIWDMLTAEMQKATTRVKFKTLIHTVCAWYDDDPAIISVSLNIDMPLNCHLLINTHQLHLNGCLFTVLLLLSYYHITPGRTWCIVEMLLIIKRKRKSDYT